MIVFLFECQWKLNLCTVLMESPGAWFVAEFIVFVRLQQCTQMVDDLVFGKSPYKPVRNFAVFERKHCGDTHYLILWSQAWALVHVDFYEFYKPKGCSFQYSKRTCGIYNIISSNRNNTIHRHTGPISCFINSQTANRFLEAFSVTDWQNDLNTTYKCCLNI